MTAYNVYRGSRLIDTVFMSGPSSAEEVRRSLINHDGYPSDIRVVRRRTPRRAPTSARENPLSKKYYVMVAEAVAEGALMAHERAGMEEDAVKYFIVTIAAVFKRDNPQFDSSRFEKYVYDLIRKG